VLFAVCANVIAHALHHAPPTKVTVLTPMLILMTAAARFAVTWLATFVMSRIEHRPMGSYGLPLRRGILTDFFVGALWGFAALSALLGVMWVRHGISVDSLAEHGAAAVSYAALWGIGFIVVGLAEEYTFRGYAQFTLAQGIGFWPAAIVLSLLFAAAHHSNSGETMAGLAEVVLIALFFCLTLWRTGMLWFAVGYHAAWDWAETFFYGTPDSGAPSAHHLLNTTFSGPHWLTGGSVGPEGSVLNIPLNVAVALLFWWLYKRKVAVLTVTK
jgi:membrane protease YdiL (CAAX protease family)